MSKYRQTEYEGTMPFYNGDERAVYIRLISDKPGNSTYKWVRVGTIKNSGGLYTYTQEGEE